jgi:hypothetical protein
MKKACLVTQHTDLLAYFGVALSALTTGCGELPEGADDDALDWAVTQAPLVSGATRVSVGSSTSESEAVITITTDTSGQSHTLVTANADHADKIIYSDGGTPNSISDDTRTVLLGASMMAIWHRFGLSGSFTHTRLLPPDGGALWGDPSIDSFGPYVVATSLRIPIGWYPSNGADLVPIVNTGGESMEPYLGGACIARSSDYGQTWRLTLDDCVNDNGHFYDGATSMVTSQGKLLAAFYDVDASQIDVWRTDGPTSSIYMTPDPFPGKVMTGHPRIENLNNPYLMAVDTSNRLWLTRYVSKEWTTPILVASGLSTGGSVTLPSGVKLRRNSGFEFTVYHSPFDGSPQIAFVITTRLANGITVLKSGGCNASSGTWACNLIAGAESNPNVSCFHPAIETGWYSPAPGVSTPSVKITYQRANSTSGQVALYASPANFSSSTRITGWQTPCPDLRGYWGDYDSMAVGPDGNFHRVFSDSTDSTTCERQGYSQMPLGVSEAVIPIP